MLSATTTTSLNQLTTLFFITGSFKRAKHIKVRFFWFKDLIDEGEVILIYVPSEELVADMLTKATTGAKFKYLRDKLLGVMEEGA